MPVFVFLSGYFTSMAADAQRRMQWLKKTLIIYAVAQLTLYVLRISLDYLVGCLENNSVDVKILSWDIVVLPELALWYLVCLVYWRLAVWAVFSKTNDLVLLAVSVVLALFSGFIPVDEHIAFQRAFAFFPFFVLGAVFRKRNLIMQLERLPMAVAAVLLLLGLFAARLLPTYLPILHYANWHQLVWRALQTGLGMFLCLLIVRLSRCGFTRLFAEYGKRTLWIYIGHIYFIILGWKLFPYFGITLNVLTAVLLAMIYCAFLVFLSRIATRQNAHR